MTFQRYYFEDLNDNVYGIVYFANKSSLNPSGIGTVRIKSHGFLDIVIHDVLYLQ